MFTDELPYGISKEGKQTIEICKPDREGLNKERNLHLDEIDYRLLKIIGNEDSTAINRAVKYLKKSVKKDAKFSAMVIDYLEMFTIIIS